MNKIAVAEGDQPSLVSIVEIAWDEGVERFELDIDNLSESTRIQKTVQFVDEENATYDYTTTSTSEKLPDGSYEISVRYEHAHNKDIAVENSWWGATKIVLKGVDRNGQVRWYDAHHSERNCTRPFKVTIGLPLDVVGMNGNMPKPIPRFVVRQQYKRSIDIHEQFGGSRQSGIAPSAASDAIFIFTGESGE